MHLMAKKLNFLAAAAALLAPLACGPGLEDVERITPEALKAAMDTGDAIPVDVRGSTSWYSGHIMGAYWIEASEIEQRANDELPRDKLIVTYCS